MSDSGKTSALQENGGATELDLWFLREVLPHESSLRAYLALSFRSSADIDDLMQEIYLRTFRIYQEKGIFSYKAFLFTVARNAVRDIFRRNAVVGIIPVTEVDPSLLVEDTVGIAESVCRSQERALLIEAIQTLPTRCREVFRLRKIEGCSQREIARRLGITENTVETLAARGTSRCIDFFRKYGFDSARAK